MRKKYILAAVAAMALGGLCYCSPDGLLTENVKTAQAAGEATNVSSMTLNMSKESGCYDKAFSLELTCSGASEIYYTLDGSNPKTSTTRIKYSGAISVKDRKNDANVLSAVAPVQFDSAYATYQNKVIGDSCSAPADNEVDKATVVKAVGVDDKGNYSSVVTNTYFVGSMTSHIQGIKESCKAAGVSLSIMSISMDYSDLFDYNKGIYVKGKVFDDALLSYQGSVNEWNIVDIARKIEANYNQRGSDWEREAHIDYLESDGTTTSCKLQQDCGIRIQGNYSRSDLQKGFRLYARADYGAKNFKYAFFGDSLKDDSGKTIDKFKKLTLRNGGNTAFLAKYTDANWQALLKDIACETQESRVCVVYLDGEYWGLYVLQEDYDDNYFEETHGVNKDDVVVYKGDAERYESGYGLDEGKLPDGVSDEGYYLDELMQFFDQHKNLEKDEDYKAFEKLVDVDSVRDFFAAEIWINNKWDFPGKNWSMWKTVKTDSSNSYADGRWRFCLYDLDFGGWSGSGEAGTNTIKEDNYKTYGLLDMNTENPAVLCFAYLMSNPSFRTDFKNRLNEMSSTNFETAKATALCEKYRDTYQPLYQQYFTRFFGTEAAEKYVTDALYGVGSCLAMTDFIEARPAYIQTMTDWVDSFYKTHTSYNSSEAGNSGNNSSGEDDSNTSSKAIKTCSITAKRNAKSITVKTLKKSKVTVVLSKKLIASGKKKVKKITVSAAKNKSGTVKIALSGKLTKGTKVTVTVAKSGYQTLKKSTKVK